MSPFQAGQPGTSAHSRQISFGAALVSMLFSVVHIGILLVSVEVLTPLRAV
jgi:hypothetical protein